ncbi:FAD-binding oxidoreductase [Bradyrhizobium sp. CER78]|uniref:FAD-binding oxidoreductase n=1 Tax=Bradyrhizobium sp. CER78 TaxID=3039162 RepID=UPI0024470291|nr:FAD-binding oxidoreductase [Bradyrhizobium sp. CER78]MDH2380874.1 FAD-binding oxidoreductase [Bradyrhizobium sp. CER78]
MKVQGDIVLPTDAGYQQDRQLANNAFQSFPQLIVYCEVFSDIRQCLAFAQRCGLTVAVRSGGHSTAGLSVNDDMVIDLSRLRYVVVDPKAHTAVVGAGTNMGHLNAALDIYHLHVPGGSCHDVCVAGFMQGGGFGYTSRCFGLNCDNVVAIRVMLADGRIVVADDKVNRDLFWAVRGGTGGNFGILLEITYRLHEVKSVWAFRLQWPLRAGSDDTVRAARLLSIIQSELTRKAPKELGYMTFLGWQGDMPYLIIRGMYVGPAERGKALLQPLLDVPGAEWINDRSGSYAEMMHHLVSTTPDLPQVPDLAREDKQSGYVARPLGPDDWQEVIEQFLETPNNSSMLAMEHYGGAISERHENDMAFVHRRVDMDVYLDVFWMNEPERVDAVTFLDRFMRFMERFCNGQSYQNYPRLAQTDYRRRYWGDVFDDLLAVKRKYDPGTFFRSAQGISADPSRSAADPVSTLTGLLDGIESEADPV